MSRFALAVLAGCLSTTSTQAAGYAIVVSRETHELNDWRAVVDRLQEKHQGRVVVCDALADALPALRDPFPTHICFVARPEEATAAFVAEVHRLTRRLDDDPYTDALWGILTGFDATNALAIAAETDPLVVRKVAAGTEIALDCCEEGLWYCELRQQHGMRKRPSGTPEPESAPADTTQALAATLTEYQADLFVTSGHATERDWQIGFRYRNGQFISRAGQLFGKETSGREFPINAVNPKVYLPVGNCLMGHIDGPDAMALAFMNSAGVRQMIGYTVLTWYGYAGWGVLDYFVEQPGRYSLSEAFFANEQALLHRLETEFPELATRNPPPGQTSGRGDGAGLLHDREVLAFYGDPAWQARLANGPLAWRQALTNYGDRYTLEITPLRGARTFDPINTNGSQRGGRPIVQFLPERLRNIELLAGGEHRPVVTDNFVLVPNPGGAGGERPLRIEFRGEVVP
jgi:zinc protease